MLTDLDREGLRRIFLALRGQEHPKIAVGFSAEKKLRFAIATLKDAGEVELWQQNPRRSSIFADASRKGIPIAWVFKDGRYEGSVVAQLPDQTEPQVYESGNVLRALLNPLFGVVEAAR
jgi:hypothetical protein